MEHVTLNNDVQMPILGFGVYQIPADQTGQVASYRCSWPHLSGLTWLQGKPGTGTLPPS